MGSDAKDPLVGTVFAGHHIERRLGAGGMGTVYLARHLDLDKLFALKTIRTEATPEVNEDRVVPRFRHEMKILSRLDHPNIVSTASAGNVGSVLWFTMTYVDGEDVTALLRRGPLTPDDAVSILEPVAAALDHAHGRHVVHRDIKPANILVAQEPGTGTGKCRVMLTDFGIASMRRHLPALTTGESPLTMQYAAPEQFRNEEATGAADVYALAATLHTLLTGEVPFPGLSPYQLVKAHAEGPRPQPSARVGGIPLDLDAVVAKGMDREIGERYASARALAMAARKALTSGPSDHRSMATTVLQTPTQAQPTPVEPPPTTRRRRAMAIVAAVLVVAATGAGLFLWSRSGDNPVANPTGTGQVLSTTQGEAAPITPTSPSGESADAEVVAVTALMTPAPTAAQVTVGGSIQPGAIVATVPPKGCDGDPGRLAFDLDGRYSSLTGQLGIDAGAANVNIGMWVERDGVDQASPDPQLIVSNGQAATFSIPATNVRQLTLRLQAMGSNGSCNAITAALYDLVGQR